MPLAKIIRDDYIAIFYSIPIDGWLVELSIFDLKGAIINGLTFDTDNPDYGVGNIESDFVNIDTDFIITKIDSMFTFKLDSEGHRMGDSTKYQISREIFKIQNNGKVIKLK